MNPNHILNVPQNKDYHPIWVYYNYTTNIYQVMRSVMIQFKSSTDSFNLTPVDDDYEIRLLLKIIHFAYDTPSDEITRALGGYEPLLYNILYQVLVSMILQRLFRNHLHSIQDLGLC